MTSHCSRTHQRLQDAHGRPSEGEDLAEGRPELPVEMAAILPDPSREGWGGSPYSFIESNFLLAEAQG